MAEDSLVESFVFGGIFMFVVVAVSFIGLLIALPALFVNVLRSIREERLFGALVSTVRQNGKEGLASYLQTQAMPGPLGDLLRHALAELEVGSRNTSTRRAMRGLAFKAFPGTSPGTYLFVFLSAGFGVVLPTILGALGKSMRVVEGVMTIGSVGPGMAPLYLSRAIDLANYPLVLGLAASFLISLVVAALAVVSLHLRSAGRRRAQALALMEALADHDLPPADDEGSLFRSQSAHSVRLRLIGYIVSIAMVAIALAAASRAIHAEQHWVSDLPGTVNEARGLNR